VCSKTEGDNTVLVGLVKGGELLRKFSLGNIGAGRVENIDDELTTSEETVGDELPRAERDWSRIVGHLDSLLVRYFS